MSKVSSPDHARELQFLRSLHREGRLQQLIYEMQKDDNIMESPATSGAMHDGSKRRLDQWEEVSMDEVNQLPLKPDKQSPKVVQLDSPAVDLPPGVESVDRWGDTLNTMGKYAGLKLSYRAMVKKAQDDADRGEKELQSYLNWVLTCSAKQSPKGADFAKYLKGINWGTIAAYGELIPGTYEPRQFV